MGCCLNAAPKLKPQILVTTLINPGPATSVMPTLRLRVDTHCIRDKCYMTLLRMRRTPTLRRSLEVTLLAGPGLIRQRTICAMYPGHSVL